jgi:hypothetical protein
MAMKSLLQEYLLQKGALPLPGLGVLTMQEEEAYHDERVAILNPPKCGLRFSFQQQETEVPVQPLLAHLAVGLQLSEEDAYDALHSYVHQVRKTIDANGWCEWQPWGEWKKENGSVIGWKNASMETVFFPVPVARQSHQNEGIAEGAEEAAVEDTVDGEEDKLSTPASSRWWILPLALGLLALAAIVWKRLF